MRVRKRLKAAEDQLAINRDFQSALLAQSTRQRRVINGHAPVDHRCRFAIERDEWKAKARRLNRRNKALQAELAEANARIEELRLAAIGSHNGAEALPPPNKGDLRT